MNDGKRGVILDVDGTLVDSNDAHARAWVEALSEAGIRVSVEEVHSLIGMGGDKLLPKLTGYSEDSRLGKRVSERRGEIFRGSFLPRLSAFPKTRELALEMRAAGLVLAVASSAKQEELSPLLELAGISDLIAHATSSSDAESSKPDPDIVRAALRRLQLDAKSAVMLGDTPYDVAAASRLGVPTVALRCGGHSDADLAGAIAIYDDPADLLQHFEGFLLSWRLAGGAEALH